MAFKFDSNNYDTSSVGANVCVPKGIYKCTIEKASLEPGKNNANSSNVKIQYSIIEGDNKGKKIFQNIVYDNPSRVAMEIGHKMLAKICKCAYKPVLNNGVDELQGSTIFVDVIVRQYEGKDQNNVFNVYASDPITGKMVDVDGKITQQTEQKPPSGFGVQTSK